MDKLMKFVGSYSGVVNFAMQQNYVPIIKNLFVQNMSEEDVKDIEVVITVEPNFAHKWSVWIETIPASQSIELGAINIKLSPDYLYSLTEKISGTILIEAKHGDDILATTLQDIEVLAYDEWSGSLIMPEIIAAFITPNHPNITEVIMKANQILQKWSGSPSFTGYQSNNPNTVKLQMAAIYTALQQENVAYCMPPASYELIGQRVRLCDSVLEQKMGTCLDLSLLYASCLEAVGLHPLIIFMKGHAFVGCWLEDECFAECVQDDISLLTKRIADGIHEICLVESTCFVAGKSVSFDNAVKAGENNLSDVDQFDFFVDVQRTRGSGVRPIPLRKVSAEGKFLYDGLEFESADREGIVDVGNAPKELQIFDKIEVVDKIEVSRQQIWERKLLDLSLRNTLVSFRVTKSAIQLMTSNLGDLEDALASGQEFQIMAKPKDWENTLRDSKIFAVENSSSIFENLAQNEFLNKRIRTFMEENEVAYSITNLYRQAKVSLEENGTNTLYLALGFLKWYESDVSEKERYAPLVLIPIDIVRKSAQKGYVIRARDEEPQMNITLLEMLRQDFGLTIGGLDPLPTDESGIDLKRVFNTIRQSVMEKSRWDVEELAFIGLFSFSQFIMWNDIRNRTDDLKRNKIVASLMSGKIEWESSDDFPSPDTLDDEFSPIDLAVPISTDSSQLSAIIAAGKGSSFVLHGPPGTGKSQTITNIIANALFQGKTVLFIAEKMAALSVVQKRLESIGLAPFCLELHSNKAKKKDVLDQLEKVLSIGKLKAPQEYTDQANRLYDLRKKLNGVVKAIHKKRDFGFSLYEAIIRFEQYREYPDCVKFTQEQIKELTSQKYELWVEAIHQLKIAAIECGGAFGNPLSEFTNSTYSQNIKSEISNYLQQYIAAINNLKNAMSKFGEMIGIEDVDTYSKANAVIRLVELINQADFIPSKLFEYQELTLLKDKVAQVCEHGKTRDELKEQLTSVFSDSILDFDAESALQQWRLAESSWFLPKMIGKRKVVKSLKIIAKSPRELKMDQVVSYINLVSNYKENAQMINDNNALFNDLFGLTWNNGGADWSIIAKTYELAVEGNMLLSATSNQNEVRKSIKEKLVNVVFCDISGFRQHNEELLKSIIHEWNSIIELENRLSQTAGVDFSKFKTVDHWLVTMEDHVHKWLDNIEGLRNWCSYLLYKERAEEAGLSNIISANENGLLTAEQLLPAFYRGVSQASAIYVVDEEKSLSEFNGAIFENDISTYKQACLDFEKLTIEELISRLSAKVPTTSANLANSSEIGILQKAIRSGGRMLSIRKLFDSIPNLLRKLSPCMLMSPISAAQYLDPKYPPFDLVIFDEASQLPTSKAVGAIARGNNVIVVGDPKQLPPTSFFNANRVDEDNFEKEDLESILDDCLALSMPQEHLLWHYRSRHESLIAFSNMQYYENKLFTFPSPNDLASSVKFISIDGYYDRGKTKQNRAEAEAVVTEIVRRLSDPVLSKQSIGVVTFSYVQQYLIDDLLMEAFVKNPELEEINNQSYEPIFIKNLENVQGDERDVILFSIGYGPDATGKTALNFGPVNREGGWRRLNVAVSRARREMMVFSTLRPEQIDLSRTRSEGVAGLKAFLEFAQKGKSTLPVKLSNISSEKDASEKLIAQKIVELGYEVHTNIGCSEYKIDIGVVHPNKKDEYVLGIMCDGKNYHSSKTARDRNVLQSDVLRSLGWNIYRLWILDWWENQDRELEKIKSAIEGAIKSNKADHITVDQSSVQVIDYERLDKDTDQVDPNDYLTYSICNLESMSGGVDEFCLPQYNQLISSQIKQILEVEAPISKNSIGKRVLASWGISRMGSRLERRLNEIIGILDVKETITNQNTFYWNYTQQPNEYRLFRVPSSDETRRNFEDIPKEEIANAIRHSLENQVSLLRSDLIKEVYKLFGFSRGSSSIEEIINIGIDEAMKRGYVLLDGDSDRIIIKD